MKRRLRLWVPVLAFTASVASGHAQESKDVAALIAHYASLNGVPASLVEKVVRRESRFNPRLHTRSFWGLMQIRPATARSLGYRGAPAGLLDPKVNLRYGVLYLANAFRVAGGDSAKAMRLFASGYYYEAKRRGRLSMVRTAFDPPLQAPAAPPPPPQPPKPTGLAAIFPFLVSGKK